MTKEERRALQLQLDGPIKDGGIPKEDFLKKAPHGEYICPRCGSGSHGDKSTGALFYYEKTNSCYCHACGKRASVFDLYAYMYGVDFSTAFADLASKVGVEVTNPNSNNHLFLSSPPTFKSAKAVEAKPEEKPEYNFLSYYKDCWSRLEDDRAVNYLSSRGITLETARSHRLGFDPIADPCNAPGGMVKPPKEDGQPRKVYRHARIIAPCTMDWYETRSIKDLGNFSKGKGGSHVRLFNIKALKTTGPVFVTEGFFDCLSVEQLGYHAVSVNGANNWRTLTNRPELANYHGTFILSPDYDDTEEGRKTVKEHFDKLEARLHEMGFKTIIDYWSHPRKDFNKYLEEGDGEGLRRKLENALRRV